MNAVLKTFLSMSFSGSLLILALFLGKQFLKDKISRQWQYYIWLVVVLRLLLPFGPDVNLMGKTYEAVDQAIVKAASLTPPQPLRDTPGNIPKGDLDPAAGTGQDNFSYAWLIWSAVALGLLIRKITIYQGFIQYIHAGSTPVSDMKMLDRFCIIAEQAGIKRPIELCVNPLVSSPLVTGFFRPCIVLPGADISEKDFYYIVLHELIHYKRLDIFYKWLVQVTVCLHWFNPFAHLMGREITRACEFSCDEAVLMKAGCDSGQDYGKTLLDAMAAVGRYKENFGAVTLSGKKRLLKERLNAIMNYKEKSMGIRFFTGVLTMCMIFGAAFVGVYSTAAASGQSSGKSLVSGKQNSAQVGNGGQNSKDYASQAERYYEADSLPLFAITFPRLDESAQRKWLEKLYADGDFAFFSVAVRGLGADSSLPVDFAEKAYADEEMAFFSTVADCMGKTELEFWLDRALEDGKWDFQSVLFDKLGRDSEFEEAQTEEYRAAGVTIDGKNYYYQGQLVNILMDIRANASFYVLDMNPAGTVNIRINRDADNKIISVTYMTETEVSELLGDMA